MDVLHVDPVPVDRAVLEKLVLGSGTCPLRIGRTGVSSAPSIYQRPPDDDALEAKAVFAEVLKKPAVQDALEEKLVKGDTTPAVSPPASHSAKLGRSGAGA